MASIRLLARAESEYREALAYFHAKSLRTGQRFRDAVQAAFDRLKQFPELVGLLDDGIHRAFVLSRFSYLIVYRIVQDEILVVAIVHGHQQSENWSDRNGDHGVLPDA